MIGIEKVQRDQIASILYNLKIDTFGKSILQPIMRVLGFQQDVGFAKSLFSERIILIFRQTHGQYQKFLAQDKVSKLQYESKLFGQRKIKQNLQKPRQKSNSNDLASLTMPDSSNINEVIKFQKTMYQCLKHLIPQNKEQVNPSYYYPPSPMHYNPLHSFTNYPIYPQRNLRQSEHQSLPSLQNPFIPVFRNPSFTTHPIYQTQVKEPHFLTFKSEPFPERDSIFSNLASVEQRKKPQSYAQPDSFNDNRSFFAEKSMIKQQIPSPRGFIAFSESQISSKPVKKLKKDSLIPVYSAQNIKNIKEQLQGYKKTFKSCQPKQNSNQKAQNDLLRADLGIKQSISEYISDDKDYKNMKQASKK